MCYLHHSIAPKKKANFEFFTRLNSNLDEVRGRLVSRFPFSDTEQAFFEVRREEARRRIMLTTPEFMANHKIGLLIAMTKRPSKPRLRVALPPLHSVRNNLNIYTRSSVNPPKDPRLILSFTVFLIRPKFDLEFHSASVAHWSFLFQCCIVIAPTLLPLVLKVADDTHSSIVEIGTITCLQICLLNQFSLFLR